MMDLKIKTKFKKLVAEGNLVLLEKMLISGISPDIKYPLQKTALMRSQNKEVLKLLLKYNANKLATTIEGNPILIERILTLKNDDANIFFLLQENISPNITNKYNQTALMLPIISAKTLKHFIAYGANVNLLDNLGKSALMYQTNEDIIKLLIDKGADVNAFDKKGKSLLMYHIDEPEIVKMLLTKNIDINHKDEFGKTALMYATNLEVVKSLLNYNVNVNLCDKLGNTALHYIVKSENEFKNEIIEELLECNANINAVNFNGSSVLMEAREIDTVKLLLQNNVKVNLKNNEGKTALMQFVSEPYISIKRIKALLNAGADINSCDNLGKTALMYATEKASEPTIIIVDMLLQNGADITKKDSSGKTAYSYVLNLPSYNKFARPLMERLRIKETSLEK